MRNKKLKKNFFFETFYNRLLLLLDFINQIALRRACLIVLAALDKLCLVLSILVFLVKYESHLYKCLWKLFIDLRI